MSSMPSTGALQAKRNRELHGTSRNEGEESGTSGQQRIGGQKLVSPNRLESKYTEPERTSSSSFKPPMLRDSIKKPKVPDLSEAHQSSSLSSAFTFLKHVFTGRGSSQPPTSTSNAVYNEPIIKIVEKNVESMKKSKVENNVRELKEVKEEKDQKETPQKKGENDVGPLPSEASGLNDTKNLTPTAMKNNNRTKGTKSVPKRPRIPFSYDPKKLLTNTNEDLDILVDKSEEYIPPTLLPSLPNDYPLDRKLEARRQKIEQFKKRHLVLPPTVLDPHKSVSNSATALAKRPQNLENTSRPEYIFPPKEIRSHVTDSNRSLSPVLRANRADALGATGKGPQGKSNNFNQKSYINIEQKKAMRSPKQRGRRYSRSPTGDAPKVIAQRSVSGGTTAYRIRSSPVLYTSYNAEGRQRSPVTVGGKDKMRSGRSPPVRPDNRWQKNSSVDSRSPKKFYTRSKSTSDKAISNLRSMYPYKASKYHKRAKSTADSKKPKSQTSFIDDRDVPVAYLNISPEYKRRNNAESGRKSPKSAHRVTSRGHHGHTASRQSRSHEAQSLASGRRFVPSNSKHTSPPRVSISSTPSPRGSKANVSQSMSPVSRKSPRDSMSNTQPTVTYIRRSKSPSVRSPTSQSPRYVQKSPSTTGRSSPPNQFSPASARRTDQQSPSSIKQSPKRFVNKSSSPWRNQIPKQQYIRKRPTNKRTPPIRQVSSKDVTSGSYAASRKGYSNKQGHSYSRGKPLDSRASRSHGDFYAIHKSAQGFGVKNKPDTDDNPQHMSSRRSNSPKNQIFNKQKAQLSSSSWNSRLKGNQSQDESKWSLKNKIPQRQQSQLRGTQGKNNPHSSNLSVWQKKNQFLHGHQTSPTFRKHQINREAAQSTFVSENRNSPEQLWVNELKLASPIVNPSEQSSESPGRQSHEFMQSSNNMEPTMSPVKQDVSSPPRTSPVTTKIHSPVSGIQVSLNESASLNVLPIPPDSPKSASQNYPLDKHDALFVSFSPNPLEPMNYNENLKIKPKLNLQVPDYTTARVPSGAVDSYYEEDSYQDVYLNIPSLSTESTDVAEPYVNADRSSSSIRPDFIEGNISNSSSSSPEYYLTGMSVEESNYFLNYPVVDHIIVDWSNSALSNSSNVIHPVSNDGGNVHNEMPLAPITKNAKRSPTRSYTAEPQQFNNIKEVHEVAKKKINTLHDFGGQSSSLPQVRPLEQNAQSAPAGEIADRCESQLFSINNIREKDAPIPAASESNENKTSVKPPLLQSDTGKRSLKMRQTANWRREVQRKGKEECSTCVPVQSKLRNESSRRSPPSQTPLALRNMRDVSPQTNTQSRRASRARRKSLQGLVQTRSPPTESSPLKYRQEGNDYASSQARLTWGRRAASSAATAAVVSGGERRYSSYQKQSSRQFESPIAAEKEATSNDKDSSGTVMKKTFSFFSSLFRNKEAEPETETTQKKVVPDDTISARPDYVRNGATVSTFYESLNKNRSSTHWLMPKPETEDIIKSANSTPTNIPAGFTNQIRLSKSRTKKHPPETTQTDDVLRSQNPTMDPDDFPTAQTKMGELP